MSSTEGLTQRKGKKGNQNAAKAPSADKEDKHKPIRASASLFPLDPITEKNLATLRQFFIPCILAVYLGIVLQGYSVKEFNGLVTNRYFLLGFRDVEALKKALVANLRDSAIWGLTYLYVRRFCNPEFRPKMATFVQDGYFGALASFATTLIKQVINNFT
ncbi:hypothetical protein NSK_005112 [Nannochloropsis salina CCMP1776]|uniref:Uncharacterized protein n=1 Tax=Nannochloropsis salina CCMP1776 TaxID=1027361 RepID=A0A4D9D0V8_9STRA|nr:hypothetical protein NSK_005112 [Nannochloropsis salina CCMP1776]|eukprot:TFJ84017.1 hypothetical protein NSK_005112 [Nannochloropsis salina CCMP1776]